MSLRIGAVCALAVVCVDAAAQEHAVGAKIGMLGLGVEYSYPFSERLSARGGIYGSSYSFDQAEAGIDYEFELNWESISVALDFHPAKSPLRLSAGLLQNDNGLSALSNVSQDVTVGGTTYTPAEVGTLRGEIGFDSVAPFFAVGWDWSRNKRFGVTLDLGVLDQGSPRVSLTADGSLLGDPAFEADRAAEEAQLEASLNDLDLFPFATIGLVFRF